MINFRNNLTLQALKKLYHIFSDELKKRFKWLVVLTFISSLADLIGLTFVIPVVGLVLDENFYNTIVHKLPVLESFTKENLLLLTVGLFFLLIIAKNAFGLYINKMQVHFVKDLYVSSTMNVLQNVYARRLMELQKDTSNHLVSKLTNMQIVLCSNAAISCIILINEAMVFALTAVIVCTWNWHLFLLLIGVLLPIMGYFYASVKNRIKIAGREKNTESIQLYARAQEMIIGYVDIKISGTEHFYKERFKKIAERFGGYQKRLDFMLFIPTRIIEIAIFLCIIILLLYGVYIIKDTTEIITTITLFSVIAYRSIPSVNRFMVAMNNLNSVEYIFKDPEFLIKNPDHERQVLPPPLRLTKSLRFENVSFRYTPQSPVVLQHCNIEIKKGEKIGIIGKSGSGKSTLISNLLGFIHPTEGKIYVDDTLLTEENTIAWWQTIGYVRQEVFILQGSLRENIAIGIPLDQIDEARLQRAIELASLSDLVKSLPEGLDTILSERGNNLSGGQKQRISIARAIYKGAEVLVFDEATSALDNKTEEEITQAIQELGKEDLTIVMIAHRYTSLRFCNRIYQLEDGSIRRELSYEELLKTI